ncbi:hypothetical protein B6U99_07850 [Candidatus Geothermarchaeota archaeon ex4572_27]|nr:MAG: hypothetical protein B6U99_07850 [Candidatus Geothermarchaeota archaeon ex4572_27]
MIAGASIAMAAPPPMEPPQDPDDPYTMLYDSTKCIGCNSCVIACKLWNGKLGGAFPFLLEDIRGPQEPPTMPRPDVHHFVVIDRFYGLQHYDGKAVFMRRSCMHCQEPPCMYVCPTGAIYQYNGVNLTDFNRCFGCQYCVVACPYKARAFHEGWGVPVKCWMCLDRVERGLPPACVSVCPVRALDFGRRSDVLRRARRRVEELRGEGRTVYVWGASSDELGSSGGTSATGDVRTNVVIISDVPFEELSFPEREMLTPAPKAYPKLLIERGGLAQDRGDRTKPR